MRRRAQRIATGLLLMLCAAPLAAQRNDAAYAGDRWYGEDKVKHLAISGAITGMAYGGSRIVLERDASAGAAVGAAAIAGLLREVHDYRLGKPFSVKDLFWDALGIVAGYFWIREIE
jgi:uncharacterized protein YfiM (DUF2279 family)